MTSTVHAHRCEACQKAGKDVFWIHSDDCAMNKNDSPEEKLRKTQAHKCPECGTVNWKKALIEPARMPQRPQAVQANQVDTILGYVVLLIAVAMICYAGYLYYQKKMKATGNDSKGLPTGDQDSNGRQDTRQ